MNPADFRLVVTSGPTREWLDPVRFISNPSSGKTGWNIAHKGLSRFREVILITGPVHREYAELEGGQTILVETTADMGQAVHDALIDNTLLVMSAAPADYTPQSVQDSKIKKSPDGLLELKLKPTMDILGRLRPRVESLQNVYLTGFAAETDNMRDNAYGKLKRKNLNFICANQVFKNQAGFGNNPNTWLVINAEGREHALGPAPKEELAEALLNLLIEEIKV